MVLKATQSVQIDGLKELDAALGDLPKATARNVLRRVLRQRAEPLAERARVLAPDDPGTSGEKDLRSSIAVSANLGKNQAKLHRRLYKDEKAFAEVFVGPGVIGHAHLQEFGTKDRAANPFMRPAWNASKDAILEGIKGDLWSEIEKAAKRLAKKQAKAAGG